VKVEVEILRIC
jgi:serine/threonine protein kinase